VDDMTNKDRLRLINAITTIQGTCSAKHFVSTVADCRWIINILSNTELSSESVKIELDLFKKLAPEFAEISA
jgi:hypothetical protein